MEPFFNLIKRYSEAAGLLLRYNRTAVIAASCSLFTAAAFLAAIHIFKPDSRVISSTPGSNQAVATTKQPADLKELLDEIAVAKRTQQAQDEEIRLLRADFGAAMKELAGNYDLLTKQSERLDGAIQEVHAYVRGLPASGSTASAGASGLPATGQKVNLNTADKTALTSLPGIGATYADRIIAYRQENGPFKQKEDLQKVPGIGPATYAKLQDLIEV